MIASQRASHIEQNNIVHACFTTCVTNRAEYIYQHEAHGIAFGFSKGLCCPNLLLLFVST